MPRVAKAAMPITETGESTSGYTLLEILGVILLFGLIAALVQPEIMLSVERNRVRYIGALLQTDLERAQAEARTDNEVKLVFSPAGYGFTIGDTVITRDYHIDGVQFQVTGSAAADAGAPELFFSNTDVCPTATITWESQHYRGVLSIGPAEAMKWSFQRK
jgi:type II secretory pathway pseudopilin PulG